MSSDKETTINELRPNRRLLDPNFDCYRLASDQLEILQHKFEERIASPIELTADQFGLCHVELRSKLNALVYDVFHPGSVFYIAQDKILHVRYENGRLSEPDAVWSIGLDKTVDDMTQSESNFLFVSGALGVILNRKGTIDLLNTEQRQSGKPFIKVLTSETGIKDGVLLSGKGRVCLDNGLTQIDVLICSVKEKVPEEIDKYPESVHFLSSLDWLTFEGIPRGEGQSTSINWTLSRQRKLRGTAVPKSAMFLYDSRASHLLVCSECQYKFDFDSVVPVIVPDQEQAIEREDSAPPLYTYIQNNEDAVVIFRLTADTSKKDVDVTIRPSSIEIKIRGETVLDGALEAVVDSSSSTWSIVDDRLEVTLMKCRAQRWSRVVKGQTKGEEVYDAAYLEEVHERLRHLTATDDDLEKMKSDRTTQELGAGLGDGTEECDEAAEKFNLIVFNGETHKGDWFLDLSGHQFIMEVPSAEGPFVVLRHHVDGLVWKFDFKDQQQGCITPLHVSTLHAFGYVSASKQDKQFTASYIPTVDNKPESSGDSQGAAGEYAAIIATNGQVYIYKSPEPAKGYELKNRKTGQVQHVAKQYALRLDGADGILGAAAGDKAIFVLSRDRLHVIVIN